MLRCNYDTLKREIYLKKGGQAYIIPFSAVEKYKDCSEILAIHPIFKEMTIWFDTREQQKEFALTYYELLHIWGHLND